MFPSSSAEHGGRTGVSASLVMKISYAASTGMALWMSTPPARLSPTVMVSRLEIGFHSLSFCDRRSERISYLAYPLGQSPCPLEPGRQRSHPCAFAYTLTTLSPNSAPVYLCLFIGFWFAHPVDSTCPPAPVLFASWGARVSYGRQLAARRIDGRDAAHV